MKKYYKYLGYLIRHKFYVACASWEMGNLWRGLMHDNSKIFPSELIPYTNYFYGKKDSDITRGRDETGYYKPTDTGDKDFDFAWLLHQKRNRHHWQWWVLPEDDGGLKIIEMTEPYRKEMLADWIGAGKAQGHFPDKDDKFSETRKWYEKNKGKMMLGAETRKWIEEKITLTPLIKNSQ